MHATHPSEIRLVSFAWKVPRSVWRTVDEAERSFSTRPLQTRERVVMRSESATLLWTGGTADLVRMDGDRAGCRKALRQHRVPIRTRREPVSTANAFERSRRRSIRIRRRRSSLTPGLFFVQIFFLPPWTSGKGFLSLWSTSRSRRMWNRREMATSDCILATGHSTSSV